MDELVVPVPVGVPSRRASDHVEVVITTVLVVVVAVVVGVLVLVFERIDRKSTRLNSSH